MKPPHAHRQYLPEPEPENRTAEYLLVAAILVAFVLVFLGPAMGWWRL